MSKIANIFELKFWWTKHFAEIDKMPEEHKKVLVEYKDSLKVKLEQDKPKEDDTIK